MLRPTAAVLQQSLDSAQFLTRDAIARRMNTPAPVTPLILTLKPHGSPMGMQRAPVTKASVRRSEDCVSPGTIMQKRLRAMLSSSDLCQPCMVPPPCASSLVHFSAAALGSPVGAPTNVAHPWLLS